MRRLCALLAVVRGVDSDQRALAGRAQEVHKVAHAPLDLAESVLHQAELRRRSVAVTGTYGGDNQIAVGKDRVHEADRVPFSSNLIELVGHPLQPSMLFKEQLHLPRHPLRQPDIHQDAMLALSTRGGEQLRLDTDNSKLPTQELDPGGHGVGVGERALCPHNVLDVLCPRLGHVPVVVLDLPHGGVPGLVRADSQMNLIVPSTPLIVQNLGLKRVRESLPPQAQLQRMLRIVETLRQSGQLSSKRSSRPSGFVEQESHVFLEPGAGLEAAEDTHCGVGYEGGVRVGIGRRSQGGEGLQHVLFFHVPGVV
mmetsp:Transcript_9438/g.23972  ORF Transcript_9438/g.23972 Transcript_9438/m.23972 type:complete len:310 (+) Transcript_9438:381-1310(+)